jgi:hypothetical protein
MVLEKSITQQQAGLLRHSKNEPSELRSLAGDRSGHRCLASRVNEAFGYVS